MSSASDPDRRQFYRVEDRVGVEYRTVQGELNGPVETLFEGGETLPLEEELRRHDVEIRHQIGLISETSRNLAQLAKALNDKLDTIARIMAFQQKPLQDNQWLPVTLSEGGLAFPAQTPAPGVGDHLAMRLTLMPELSQVVAIGEVVSVDEKQQPPIVHLQFTRLEDHERQQIARHVLRIQARERQQQRQRDELNDSTP